MIEVVNIRVRSFDLSYLDLYWDVKPCFEDVNDFQFIVEASDAEYGKYFQIADPLINIFHFRDTTVRGQHSYYHERWYRVRVQFREVAKQTSGGSSTDRYFPTQGGVSIAAVPDLHALEMARIHRLKLQEFQGRKIWIYAKRRFGQRCSVCFDPVTQRKMRADCPTCYGAGFVGGYHAPVETYGMIVSPEESTAHTNFTNVEMENTMMMVGNYPDITSGDLVIEAENVRWRVGDRITKVRKARALIRQQVPLHRIPSGDVEYSVPLNLTTAQVKDLTASPERNYTNPHTLESANLPGYLKSVFGSDL